MSNRKQLRKAIKREKSIALKEKSNPTKKRKNRLSEYELFNDIDRHSNKDYDYED